MLPEKEIIGSPFYNILSNPEYQDKFCYYGAHIKNRHLLIKDSDTDDANNFE